MLQLDELKLEMEALEPEIDDIKKALQLEQLREEVKVLEQQAAEPDFWSDMEQSQKILQKTTQKKRAIEDFEKLENGYADVMTMIEIANEENDESLVSDIYGRRRQSKKRH